MPSANLVIQADRPCTISEVAAVTEVDSKKINRFIDSGVLPEYTYRKEPRNRAIFAFACPIIKFYSSESGAFLTKNAKREVADWLVQKLREHWSDLLHDDGGESSSSRVVRDVAFAMKGYDFDYRKDLMALALNDSVQNSLTNLEILAQTESCIIEDPDIRGGIPTIKGTRISPYEAASLALADGIDSALEDYPSLSRKDFETAIMYTKANPPRGRPKSKNQSWRKHWRLVCENIDSENNLDPKSK